MENTKRVINILGNIILFLFKFALAINLLLVSYLIVVLPIWLVELVGSDIILWLLGIWGGFTGLTILTWQTAKNRAGILFAGIPFAYSSWLIDEIFINSHSVVYFVNIGSLGWFAMILTTTALVLVS